MGLLSSRAVILPLVVLSSAVAVIGGTAAGAASVHEPKVVAQTRPGPQEVDDQAAASQDPQAQKQRLTIAMGTISQVGKRGIAIVKPGQEKPTMVAVRPATRIWLDHERTTLEGLQPGDRVAVLGSVNPRGAILARGIRAHR